MSSEWDSISTRSRSSATIVRDARDETMAAMLMVDAFEAVTAGHSKSVKNFLKHKVSQGVRTMSTADRVSTGVGLAVAAGVGIAGIVLSGGLAIPVILAIGAGTYALRTAISNIGNDLSRSNRNWLQRYPQARNASTREEANFLACEAGDAIRRAIDHYRTTKTIISSELAACERLDEYATCADAVNHVKAVARFVHHGDKVRNYVLPCLDLCIFYMKQYKEMCDTWENWEPTFRHGLTLWFSRHPLDAACSENEADLCYHPRSATSPLPRRPHNRSKSGWNLPVGSTSVPPSNAIEITDLIEAMEQAKILILSGMHTLSGGDATYNYHAETPSMTRVRAASPSSAHMAHARTLAMVDAVWQQVDRPGYLTRATRRIGHWYTRNNKTEKVAAVFGTVTDIGSIFLPFLKGVDTLSDVAKSAINGSVSATTTIANTIGMGALTSKGQVPMQTNLLNREYIQEMAMTDIRGSGATVATLMTKLCTHFRNAATVLQELQGVGTAEITNCKQAFGLASHVCELIHELNKVNAYLLPVIGLTDYVAAATHSWAGSENDIWMAMERDVSAWVATGDHSNCREQNTVCYGPKHHRTGGGFFSSSPVTWHVLSDSTPHKPLT